MARQCAVCEKRKHPAWTLVKLRGKYNPTKKRDQKPNLQWVTLYEPFASKWKFPAGSRIKACAKCIKSLGKIK